MAAWRAAAACCKRLACCIGRVGLKTYLAEVGLLFAAGIERQQGHEHGECDEPELLGEYKCSSAGNRADPAHDVECRPDVAVCIGAGAGIRLLCPVRVLTHCICATNDAWTCNEVP